jgi:hypothetical protein
MENNLAVILVALDDIINQFEASRHEWRTRHKSRADLVDDDNAHYARLMALKGDLAKEAARQNAVTVAEIETDARAYEADHPGR